MKKGFTLLELLIVIAILAILAAAAVVVLNPAELLRRARDSERITDLANTRNSLNLYLTTVTSPDLDSTGSACSDDGDASAVFTHLAINDTTATLNSPAHVVSSTNSARLTDGTGWIPVNLNNTAGGSPLSALPVDPRNVIDSCSSVADADDCFYYYICNDESSTYEIGGNMESAVYSNDGDDDVESADGGDADDFYELGNDSGLDL